MRYKVAASGMIYRPTPQNGKKIDGKFNGVYKYSEAVFRRIKQNELACIAVSTLLGYNNFLVTLTFPIEYSNHHRWRINDRFRKAARMYFPEGGVWCAEAHTGNGYVSKHTGTYIAGNAAMRGLVHFHYRIITTRRKFSVLRWIINQQKKDGVHINSYDISSKARHMYQGLYIGKEEQKALVSHTGRIWAKWGKFDSKPVEVSAGTVKNELQPAVSINKKYLHSGRNDLSLWLQREKLAIQKKR